MSSQGGTSFTAGELNAALCPDLWVERHADSLYRYAFRRTGRADVAQDLVQDALLAAWRSRDGYRGQASERNWLMGILKNKIVDHFRAAMRRMEDAATDLGAGDDIESLLFDERGSWRTPPAEWGNQPLEATESGAFWGMLSQCLERVPSPQREAFLLRDVDGADAAESSHTLGVSANHLYVLLHRARLRIRQCLEHRWLSGGGA